MRTYIFKLVIQKEEDGRYSIECPALPGCVSWGYTEEEAIKNIREAVEVYVEDLIEAGEFLPIEKSGAVEVLPEPAVSVTI